MAIKYGVKAARMLERLEEAFVECFIPAPGGRKPDKIHDYWYFLY